jgi:hypothetical protein
MMRDAGLNWREIAVLAAVAMLIAVPGLVAYFYLIE